MMSAGRPRLQNGGERVKEEERGAGGAEATWRKGDLWKEEIREGEIAGVGGRGVGEADLVKPRFVHTRHETTSLIFFSFLNLACRT